MSKAEKYIKEKTDDCSNVAIRFTNKRKRIDKLTAEDWELYYMDWLTPDAANEAVRIARKETAEWFAKNWRKYLWTDADGVIHFGHWRGDFKKKFGL